MTESEDATPSREEQQFEQPDASEMSAGDWREYLKSYRDRCLVVRDPKGTHTFEYDEEVGEVTFLAHGSMGYDFDGTQAALESVAHSDDGIRVQTRRETYA